MNEMIDFPLYNAEDGQKYFQFTALPVGISLNLQVCYDRAEEITKKDGSRVLQVYRGTYNDKRDSPRWGGFGPAGIHILPYDGKKFFGKPFCITATYEVEKRGKKDSDFIFWYGEFVGSRDDVVVVRKLTWEEFEELERKLPQHVKKERLRKRIDNWELKEIIDEKTSIYPCFLENAPEEVTYRQALNRLTNHYDTCHCLDKGAYLEMVDVLMGIFKEKRRK